MPPSVDSTRGNKFCKNIIIFFLLKKGDAAGW